jgi:hypothetical protein
LVADDAGYVDAAHHALSGWVISRFFAFAGGACLAAAVAVVALALPFVLSNAAPAEEQSPAGVSLDFDAKDGTLYIEWSGPIVAGTADDLRAALGKYVTASDRVVLFLDSAGGQGMPTATWSMAVPAQRRARSVRPG